MELVDVVALVTLAALVSFVGGVVFHKAVISDAQAIKEHVSDEVNLIGAEVASLRGELKSYAEKIAAKI